MTTKLLATAVSVIAFAATLAGQAAPAGPESGKAEKSAPAVLTGCVASPTPGTFTLEDEHKGRFELTGRKLDVYIGKRVEIRSGGGLHITTGLYPSPNIAAQAGAIDPVEAARANMPGSPAYNANNVPLSKITVTQIKRLPGSCPAPSK